MYLRETFWLCLVVMVRMYICNAANRSAASYLSSWPNRSKTTSLQLCSKGESYIRVLKFFGACEAHFISTKSYSSTSASPLSCNKLFTTSVARDPFKGMRCSFQSQMKDSETQNGELWQKEKKMINLPSLRLFHLTNYQRNPQEAIYYFRGK